MKTITEQIAIELEDRHSIASESLAQYLADRGLDIRDDGDETRAHIDFWWEEEVYRREGEGLDEEAERCAIAFFDACAKEVL